ncbi:ATP-binding protein [Komagataeibacter oboediens]|uniref:ATP-binding protein n=1 Tax=Komagataeibacter oboediens TaxID=65958 RepID=UPI001C2DC601|nr:ATP-binding protein [Komagataeibacter oboediens]MBV1824827.1 ATP-binding protein [Komagataeibacter oboediens]
MTVVAIENGALQEGRDLDFKRLIDLGDQKFKSGLVDDVVSFLNRGSGRILVGVDEEGSQLGGFRPLAGFEVSMPIRTN